MKLYFALRNVQKEYTCFHTSTVIVPKGTLRVLDAFDVVDICEIFKIVSTLSLQRTDGLYRPTQ